MRLRQDFPISHLGADEGSHDNLREYRPSASLTRFDCLLEFFFGGGASSCNL